MKRLNFFKRIISVSVILFSMGVSFAQTKHTVAKGDTFYSISKKYNVSVDEICSSNNLTKDSVLKIGQVLTIPETKVSVSSTSASKENSVSTTTVKTIDYEVKKGDTFSSIAKSYNMTVDALCSLNNLKKDDVLKIGQKLKVKEVSASSKTTVSTSTSTQTSGSSTSSATSTAATTRKYDTYTVQKGDTFYRIAKINNISVDELKSLNNLSNEAVLKVGDKLKIPATIVDTQNTTLPDLTSSDPRNYSTKKGDSSLAWPVKNPTVTYTKGKVSGVQLSAAKNENVTAIRAGTVMYVGNYRGYGQVIFVQSKTGHIYAYTGLGSIKAKKGDYVVFGDVLGTAGTDSIKGTSQICLMVFQKSVPIDPAKAPRG